MRNQACSEAYRKPVSEDDCEQARNSGENVKCYLKFVVQFSEAQSWVRSKAESGSEHWTVEGNDRSGFCILDVAEVVDVAGLAASNE